MKDEHILSIENLAISFDGVRAADGIDIDVVRGECLAIIGPNGSGKTTFVNLCTGYLKPCSGSILFDGIDITASSPNQVARLGVARSFQLPQLFHDRSVLENLLLPIACRRGAWEFFRRLVRPNYVEEAHGLLRSLGLHEFSDRAVGELSEGTKKLLDVGIAVMLNPKLLILDEPTSSVSKEEKATVMGAIMNSLKEREITSVFIEHDMDIVMGYADRVAVWGGGRVVKICDPTSLLSDDVVIGTVTGPL